MTLRPVTTGDKARRAAWNTSQGAKAAGSGAKKAGRKVKNAYWNATSKPVNSTEKVKKPLRSDAQAALGPNIKFVSGYTAGMAGVAAGTGTGAAHYHATKKKDDVHKAFLKKVPRITDAGTRGEKVGFKQMKQDAKKWPHLPKKTMAGSFVVGGALGHVSAKNTRELDAEIAQTRKKSPVTKSDPFNISKFDPNKGSLRSQGLAFKDKGAAKRTTKDFNHGYARDVRAFRTDPKNKAKARKEVGIGAGIGGVAGAALGAASNPGSRGKYSALAGAGGAAIGATYGTLPSSQRTNNYAFGTAMPKNQKRAISEGKKRGDVVRIKDKKQAGAWSQTVKKSEVEKGLALNLGTKTTMGALKHGARQAKKGHATQSVAPNGSLGQKFGRAQRKYGQGVANAATKVANTSGGQEAVGTGIIAGGVAGAAAGAGGAFQAYKNAQKNKKHGIQKSGSTSAFGIEHG